MEFTSGYRELIVEFSELLFIWYRRYLSDCANRPTRGLRNREQENRLKNLPYDSGCWVIHVLKNDDISFRTKNPEQQIGDGFYGDDALCLRDLDKYISLIDLDGVNEVEEGLGEEVDDLYRIDYLLMVSEETGNVMGVDFLMNDRQDGQLGPRAYHLLCQCMTRPMGAGQPRRPRRLAVGDATVHAFLSDILPSLGVRVHKEPLRDWTLNPDFSFSSKAVRSCHVCKKRSFETTLTPCDKCSAVLYCSERCKNWDWKKCPTDISHEYWCRMMAQYMQCERDLADLPFPFSREVTSPSFDKEKFLRARHLTGGYWSAESIHHQTYRLLLKRSQWDLDGGSEHFEPLLKDTEIILKQHPTEGPKNTLMTWKEYYEWRTLSLDNPIAALLTYPLTIYYIITGLVPKHFPELNVLKKQSLKIHIIEASREYESVLIFWELAVLMPHVVLELVFVGETLPVEDDERHFILHKQGADVICSELTFPAKDRCGRGIHIKIHSRPYHTLQAAKPDLVIGFNSGFGLNDTWLSTLPRLQSLKVPAYFSDCSQYSCDVDGQIVSMATGGTASSPSINPFRSPLRIAATDNLLPWYNNAFLFYLIYKSAAHSTRQRNNQGQTLPSPTVPSKTDCDPTGRKKKRSGKNCRKRK
ncbi:zinc finger MYND domain-containing protein 15 [Discoglossus pictus]